MGAGTQRWWRGGEQALEGAGLEWLRQQNALIGAAIRRLPSPGAAKQIAQLRDRIEALNTVLEVVTRSGA